MKFNLYTLLMDFAAIITIVISVIGLFGTLLGFVIKLSVNLGRYVQRQDKLIDDFKEQELRNREKFNDYYQFKYDVAQKLSTIAEKLDAMQGDMKEIKDDIKGNK